MKRWHKSVLIFFVVLLVGPFLIPVPAVKGTVPARKLAGPDSNFVDINGIEVHYIIGGTGEPTYVLLHGFGASTFSWREVMEPLSEWGTVIAFDRPAFGLTERPRSWQGTNPYSAQGQVELTLGLLDAFDLNKATLVGHSAGGTVALDTALQHPERVERLVLIAPAVYTNGGSSRWLQPLLQLPQVKRLGPLFVRSIATRGEEGVIRAWHNQETLTEDVLEGYKLPLKVDNWDRGLWEFVLAGGSRDLESSLANLVVSTLVVTGNFDQVIPPGDSIRLADDIDAFLSVVPGVGHLPHEEDPDAFLEAVYWFMSAP